MPKMKSGFIKLISALKWISLFIVMGLIFLGLLAAWSILQNKKMVTACQSAEWELKSYLNEQDRNCNYDEECTAYMISCESFIAVKKEALASVGLANTIFELYKRKKQICEPNADYPNKQPKYMTDAVPCQSSRQAKCISHLCTIARSLDSMDDTYLPQQLLEKPFLNYKENP